MDFYLSLSASKQLREWGCDLNGSFRWRFDVKVLQEDRRAKGLTPDFTDKISCRDGDEFYKSYHLLEDICVKYAKEFFGRDIVIDEDGDERAYVYYPHIILTSMQRGEIEIAEEILLSNTVFNPENRK